MSRTLSDAVRPLDERPADVPVADQPFDARDAERERHRVGRRLARVRHRHHDRVRRVRSTRPRPVPAAPVPVPGAVRRQVHAAVVERAGHVCEVDPLEEAVGGLRGSANSARRPRTGRSPSLDQDHLARLERLDRRGSRGSAARRSRSPPRTSAASRRSTAAGARAGRGATTMSPIAFRNTRLYAPSNCWRAG